MKFAVSDVQTPLSEFNAINKRNGARDEQQKDAG